MALTPAYFFLVFSGYAIKSQIKCVTLFLGAKNIHKMQNKNNTE